MLRESVYRGDKLKRLLASTASFLIVIAGLATSASASDGFTYQQIGVAATPPSGLTITMNSLELVEKSGSVQLLINYTQKNNTPDKKLDEGSFVLFYTDGTSESQYGFFGSFFPGDGNTRSYKWEWLKSKEPWLIEWNAGFGAAKPTAAGLKWKVGPSFPAPSATPAPTASTEISAVIGSFKGKWAVRIENAQGKSVAVKAGTRWYRFTSRSASFLYSQKARVGSVIPVTVYVDGILTNVATLKIK